MNTSILYEQDPNLDSIFAKKKKTDVIVKTEPVIKPKTDTDVKKTDTDTNIKKTDDIPIKNPINKPGRLTLSNKAKADQIDLNLFQDLKKAVKAANIGNVEITFARTGHDKYTESGNISRHYTGNAVDISRLNGITYQDDRKTFTVLGNLLVAELKKLGYVLWESGNKKSYIWQAADHYDHIHVSTLPSKNVTKMDIAFALYLNNVHDKIQWYTKHLYDVFTKNPAEYFDNFSGVFNDDEEGAANWLKSEFRKDEMELLTSLEKQAKRYDKANIKMIRDLVEFMIDTIRKGNRPSTFTAKFWKYNRKTKKLEIVTKKYIWNYM
jgi:hypothetical protein